MLVVFVDYFESKGYSGTACVDTAFFIPDIYRERFKFQIRFAYLVLGNGKVCCQLRAGYIDALYLVLKSFFRSVQGFEFCLVLRYLFFKLLYGSSPLRYPLLELIFASLALCQRKQRREHERRGKRYRYESSYRFMLHSFILADAGLLGGAKGFLSSQGLQ